MRIFVSAILAVMLGWSAPAASALGGAPQADDGKRDGKITVRADLQTKKAQNKAGETTTAMRLAAAKAQAAKGKKTPVLTTAGIEAELAREPEKADVEREMQVGKEEFDRKAKGLAARGAGGAKRSVADIVSVDPRPGCTQIVCTQPDFYATPNYANSPLRMPDALVSVTSAAGTGAALAAEVDLQTGAVTAVSVPEGSGGSGYAVDEVVVLTSVGSGAYSDSQSGTPDVGTGTGAVARVSAVDPGTGAITAVEVTSGGTGYVTAGIRKFVDTLPGLGVEGSNNLKQYIPIAVPDTTTYPGSDYYEIALVQYTEQMHSDLPATLLRGYVQLSTAVVPGGHIPLTMPSGAITLPGGAQAYAVDRPSYLGPFIAATKDRPVRILFRNLLPTGQAGNLFLPVDMTVMGAGMGPAMDQNMPHDDQLPMCADQPKPAGCFAENRATLHLHGGITPWISDGTPHQWITPAGENTAYPKGVSVQNVPDMPDPGPGAQTFFYTNQQSARLMFYHDHAWGITRLNVYAGEAAGYSITDEVETRLVSQGLLPGADATLPLIVQDKTFVPDTKQLAVTDPLWDTSAWGAYGQLWAPHVYMPNQSQDSTGANPFGRWAYGWWFHPATTDARVGPIPNAHFDPNCDPDVTYCQPSLAPGVPWTSMGMESFNDTPTVNGTAYPQTEVDPKAYRLRFLNASNDRFFNFSLYEADSRPGMLDAQGLGTEVALNAAEVAAAKDDPTVFPTPDTAISRPGPNWITVASEGGWLPTPAVVPAQPTTWVTDPARFDAGNVDKHSLLIAPAERADTIVDFSAYAGKTLILYNDAPAAYPARDSRQDYYTDNADLTAVGGTAPTPRGFGPNTRTIMRIKVKAAAPAPAYATTKLPQLTAAFAHQADGSGVFESGQHPVVVGQKAYNTAYGTTFDTGALGVAPNERLDGLVRMTDTKFDFQTLAKDATQRDGQVRLRSFPLAPKAIHDEMSAAYDKEYGRMSGNLGLEGPNKTAVGQQLMLYPYVNPPDYYGTPDIEAKYPFDGMTQLTPLATLDDGTQIWKITHNGVDTHPIHFHLFDIQLVNRVGWDNIIRKPEATELGWKDTVRVSPLEDTIVALRPILPKVPWGVPDSLRPLDPSMPLGSSAQFNQVGADGNALSTTITNEVFNFRWEYVWHCHILSHEEMDMMRPYAVKAPNLAPAAPTGPNWHVGAGGVQIEWTDATPVTSGVNDPGSGWGVWSAEYQFRFQYAPVADQSTWTDAGTALANATSTTLDVGAITSANQNDYVFRVVARNAEGDAFSAAVGPSVPPSAPAGLTATAQPVAAADPTAGIQLDWTGSTPDPAATYAVQRATDAAFTTGVTDIGTTADPTVTYTDSGLPFGASYYYRVRGIAAGGAVSPWSNVASATTGFRAPLGVSATASAGPPATVTVAWTDVPGGPFTYEIGRSPGSVFDPGNATVVSSPDTGVAPNATYTYAVRALLGATPSEWSASATATTIPDAPTGLSVTAGATPDALVVSWTAPAAVQVTPVTGYVLERSVAGGPWTAVSGAPLTDVSFTDTGLPFASSVSYRVASRTDVPQLSEWTATVTAATTGLPAPTNVVATSSTSAPAAVSVTWDAVAAATAYEVEVAANGGPFAPLTTVPAGTLTASVPAPSFDTGYVLQVRATAAGAASLWSPSNAVTTIPAPPGVVTATPGAPGVIDLSWLASPTAGVTYTVERSTDAGFAPGSTTTVVSGLSDTTLTDSGLLFVTTYFYRVTAVNAHGTSPASTTAVGATTGAGAPALVTVVATAAPPATVTVSWTPVQGAAGYDVERAPAGSGAFVPVGSTTTEVTLVDSGVAVDSVYVYRVRSTAGPLSSPWTSSGEVSTIPTAPTGLTSVNVPGSTATTLVWTGPSAPVVPVTGYVVQRATDAGFTDAVDLATTTATNYADTPPVGATTYYYRVATLNAVGRSAYSSGIGAISALRAPTTVTATPSAGAPTQVTVTWAPVAGATGYQVVRSDGTVFTVGAPTWTATAGAADTSATDSSVLANTAYTYAVRATATVSGLPLTSDYTAAASIVTIPDAPALQPVAQGSTQDALVVSWTAPGGQLSPITGYVLERSLNGIDGWTAVPTAGTGTSVTDSGLAFLTTYHYRVATLTSVGQSAWSAAQSATTGLEGPASATAAASTSGASVTVTWTAVPTVTAYEVARSDGATFVAPGTSLSASETGLSYLDATVAFGTTYTYAVRAILGGTQSGWTVTNPVTTIPAAPSGLVVTSTTAGASDATVNLAWSAQAGATGYVVQRSSDAGFTAPVAVTAIDQATASDMNLPFVTTYYYRVAGTNATGQSAWSMPVQVTTPLGAPTGLTASDSTTPPVSVTLAWTGNGATGSYEVRRSVGSTFDPGTATLVYAGLDATTTDTGAAAGTTYTYGVKGLTPGGAVSSAWTTIGVVTLPDAPTGLGAVAGSGTVTVSWTASLASGVTYTVERSSTVDFSTDVTQVGAPTSGTSIVDPVGSIATYYYRVRATNGEGTSAWSATAAASTALTAPATLTGTVSAAWPLVVTLTWDAVSGATGYELQRSTTAAFTTVTSVPGATGLSGPATTAVDTTAASTTTYYYRVRATAADGGTVSGWTVIAAPVATPSIALARVSGLALQIAPSGASPTLEASWTGQPWAASYTVQIATNSSFTTGLVVQSVTTPTTSLAGLTVGVRYYVRVRAEQPTVQAAWSLTSSLLMAAPPRPATLVASLLAVAPGTADLRLTWTPGSAAPVGGYLLQRATDSGYLTAVTIATPGPTATTFDDLGLARNVRYYYRIVAVTSAGQSSTWRTMRYRTPA